jgi:serine protease AprX
VAAASSGDTSASQDPTYVPASLLESASNHPDAQIPVIIQSTAGVTGAIDALGNVGDLNRKLNLVDGVAVTLPAAQLAELAKLPGLTITSDAPMKPSGRITSGRITYTSDQIWPYVARLTKLWRTKGRAAENTPTIAIVDSGIQADRADFAGRVVADVNLSTLPNNTTPGDGRGHGTFVAGIAAGAAAGYAGAAPSANLASIDVMNDAGIARTSDVIAACQWILAHKDKYNIRVANFSMHSGTPSNFTWDPLDRAVEKLWFNGVTVVTAAGNYGTPTGPSRVKYAPGNDPFVITVGAVDMHGTIGYGDDTAAPWSAYGYTYDGFWKPEISAPGRYMVGPIPPNSTLAAEKAANITAPGYIQLSGTSFAAPAVAGAAAQILARHPSFTPDQVKGALMGTAHQAPLAAPGSLGLGELDASAAASVDDPANPNKALEQYLMPDPAGGSAPVFDSVAWGDAIAANVAWNAVAWSDVSWSAVAWGDVAWSDVAWSDISRLDVSTTDVAWGDVSWNDLSYEDKAEGDASPDSSAYLLSPADAAALRANPDWPATDALPPSGVDSTSSEASSNANVGSTLP